jgi:hypothetical protein
MGGDGPVDHHGGELGCVAAEGLELRLEPLPDTLGYLDLIREIGLGTGT